MGDVVAGTGVVAGVVRAPAVWMRRPQIPGAEAEPIAEPDRAAQTELLKAAVEDVAVGYERRAENSDGVVADVLSATAALARDRGWVNSAVKAISGGLPAAPAAASALESFMAVFRQVGGVMAERVTDLTDIRDRVIARVTGQSEPGLPQPSEPSILLADDLSPADTADLNLESIIGIATRLGGPTSHTAIIARQRGLPCVVGIADLESIAEGDLILLDGSAGTVSRDVAEAEAEEKVAADAARRAAFEGWTGPGCTSDGHHVQLLANVADGEAAATAAAGAAEGVGLYRTELGFLGAHREPSVAEQVTAYAAVLDAFAGAKVVIRTLDAGTDKPVPFASLPDEANPALGVRGHRLGALRPGLVERQLDAIVRATDGHPDRPWVMAPMISTLDEATEFTAMCHERGLMAGIMVEVPAVALMADEFLSVVDFVSIGTNDLTQYAMAADRLSADLSHLTDPWQPAVLRLIQATAEAAHRADKPVGVCGEAAADPLLACVLTGLGATSLSMAAAAIPAVGVALSHASLAQCQEAARLAVSSRTAASARKAAASVISVS